jgi:ABC-2 type transport system ATP-binding protein
MENIIEVKNLTKKYGGFTAVEDISFQVKAGEIFGILGPNGAGKTTTLEMIEGLKPITSGQAFLDGHDVSKEARLVKSLIGVQLQSSAFFAGLNLVELLETYGAMYGRKIDGPALLASVQLTEKTKNQAKELSGGQKQRLSIAVALVNDPKVVFLDEPTTGLDPQARRNLWELIKDINQKGKTVVLTTHYMDEAEILCDRIAIMDHAKIVKLDTVSGLIKNSGVNSTLEFRLKNELAPSQFKTLPGVLEVTKEDLGYEIITEKPEATLPAVFSFSQQHNLELLDLQLRQPNLEDVFIKFTGHQLRE